MKFAVVLGASGEIGQAISKELATAGWSLYLHYHANELAVVHLHDELQATYTEQQFVIVQADFQKEGSIEQLVGKTRNCQAIIVANGHSVVKLLSETTTAEMQSLWQVHMQSPAFYIQKMASTLRKFARSYIVFIGSIWGQTGAANEVMYSAVKGAQHAFVKAYAKEAAYAGIRVNGIAPGWIDTPMNAGFTEEDQDIARQEIPLMRVGTPEEVSKLVRFLVSGDADYMTGEIVKLNGGWHI